MDGHDRDLLAVLAAVIFHHEADMLEEGAERLIFLHGADKLGEVLESSGALGRTIGLQHRRVAGFVEDQPRQFRVRKFVEARAPAREIAD